MRLIRTSGWVRGLRFSMLCVGFAIGLDYRSPWLGIAIVLFGGGLMGMTFEPLHQYRQHPEEKGGDQWLP